VAFVDDDPKLHGQVLNGLPVWSYQRALERHAGGLISCTIGSPGVREHIVERCRADGFRFARLVHPEARMSRTVEVGAGCILCVGGILTVNITLGEHVHVNLDCTIGHDVTIGDYSTLTPGVHVSGCVEIGRKVFIGTGTNIINGSDAEPLVIGDGTVIGAGAVVRHSTEPGSLYAGVPARRKR
jgi:sugar O-acyltransferase (sialic acid O-acetyltransferase NeuD family)